jgi:hypothetical protein
MSDLAKRLKKLEGPKSDLPRLLLVAQADGTYRAMSTGRVYSQQEVDELEAAGEARVVILSVVYDDKGVKHGNEPKDE